MATIQESIDKLQNMIDLVVDTVTKDLKEGGIEKVHKNMQIIHKVSIVMLKIADVSSKIKITTGPRVKSDEEIEQDRKIVDHYVEHQIWLRSLPDTDPNAKPDQIGIPEEDDIDCESSPSNDEEDDGEYKLSEPLAKFLAERARRNNNPTTHEEYVESKSTSAISI